MRHTRRDDATAQQRLAQHDDVILPVEALGIHELGKGRSHGIRDKKQKHAISACDDLIQVRINVAGIVHIGQDQRVPA